MKNWALLLLGLCGYTYQVFAEAEDYGTLIGSLVTKAHDVSGEVYAVDQERIFIKGLTYDGAAPDAFFYVGTSSTPDSQGVKIPYEYGHEDVLGLYSGKDIVLYLPSNLKVKDIKWLSVWCRDFAVDFGSLQFPDDLSILEPANLGPLSELAHQASSGDVFILDPRRMLIKTLTYDGLGPDVYFYVGSTDTVSLDGNKIPDENGNTGVLKAYNGIDVTLTLPEGQVWSQYKWLSLWCLQFSQDFGHVMISGLDDIPPYFANLREAEDYGTLIGSLVTKAHDVSGEVYAVDQERIFIKRLTYDGTGPDAFFYVGNSGTPNSQGVKIPDEYGRENILSGYNGKDIVLYLPSNLKVKDIKWLSVWCRQFAVDFGSLQFPDDLSVPEPANLGPLSELAHQVSSGDVFILDPRRMLIKTLTYDGLGPDAYFYVGSTDTVGPDGNTIPDENGNTGVLKAYSGVDVTLTLPEGQVWSQYKWLSLWCLRFTQDFGHVMISGLDDIPNYFANLRESEMSNCETLHESLNVKWEIDGSDIIIELIGAIDSPSGYMAFGISGSNSYSSMVNGDVTVASYSLSDPQGPKVEDYFLQAYAFCSGTSGVCPDAVDNSNVISGHVSEGITTVRYSRSLNTGDATDKVIPTTGSVHIIWALGRLNDQGLVTKHHTRLQGSKTIEFGRAPSRACSAVQVPDRENVMPWTANMISVENVNVIKARIGPAGGNKGYTGITGRQSWGIAWYLNGLLIPELIIRRGDTVTFKVYGGQNPVNSAKYHPLYITDDSVGGYAGKTPQDKNNVEVIVEPREGPYCEYEPTANSKLPEEYETFAEYSATLDLECESYDETDETAYTFTWTPDHNTADLVYYQCYTHNYLGWKIHVVDEYSSSESTTLSAGSELSNCEILHESLNIEWEIDGTDIIMELIGTIDSPSGYMAFGISGSNSYSSMVNGDVTVASYSLNDPYGPKVEDYFLQAYAVCSGNTGVCPDAMHGGSDNSEVISGHVSEGITTVRYFRPLNTGDSTDKVIPTTGSVHIIWALGILNEQGLVTKHHTRLQGGKSIEFGRVPRRDCSAVQAPDKETVMPWISQNISVENVNVIEARIGPAGGNKGYTGITGRQSLGMAWYLKGLLIPEVTIRRGDTVTFKVYGGLDPANSAKYHPLYITDDPVGGYAGKTQQDKNNVKIFAEPKEGPYCEHETTANSKLPEEYETFAEYSATLNLKCEPYDELDETAYTFTWTPDDDTPDLVYYQCYTHKNLGWKIHVVDDNKNSASVNNSALGLITILLIKLLL